MNNRNYHESENYIDEMPRFPVSKKLRNIWLLTLIGLILATMLSSCGKEGQYTFKKHKYKVTVGAFNANISFTHDGITTYPASGTVVEFESHREFSVTFTITRYPNSHEVIVERDGVWHQHESRTLENKGDKTYIIK